MFYNKKKGTCKEIFVNQTKCTLLIFFGNRLAFMKHIKFSFAFSHRSFATTKCSFMEILKQLFFLLRPILYDDYSWEVFQNVCMQTSLLQPSYRRIPSNRRQLGARVAQLPVMVNLPRFYNFQDFLIVQEHGYRPIIYLNIFLPES